ncbi:hypothetical protein TrVE_jg5867 [Triparma verrucosa]|nr:hypothetical protein TrVE_jg5867 [Triparma verrucosa]
MSIMLRTRQLIRRDLARLSNRRCASSNGDDETRYIEEWQATCIRPNSFYELHASSRTYFYSVDLQGRLFLEETSPKNIATSLKSDKFLDFFFSQLRPNKTGKFEEYPFFSPCGKESNYIRPACLPIVFHDLTPSNSLVYAGTLLQKFHPSNLRTSSLSGRIFHRLFPSSPSKKSRMQKSGESYGLIKSSIAGKIAENIFFKDDGGMYYVDDEGEWEVGLLPDDQESVSWGLPSSSI